MSWLGRGDLTYSLFLFSLALTYPEITAGRARSLGFEQVPKTRVHQPWSHVCCRKRQMHLVGRSRRKASPGWSCPSAGLMCRGRTREWGPEPGIPSEPCTGSPWLWSLMGPNSHSGSKRSPATNLCHVHSQGKQVFPNEQVCSTPCSQHTWLV